MNEKQLIKKVSELQQLSPSSERMNRVKSRLFHNIGNDIPTTKNRYSTFITTHRYVFLSLFIMLLFIFSGVAFKDTIQSRIYTTRIALAPNHYQKAKLALEEAQTEFEKLPRNSSFQEEMDITTTTQQFITELHLEGEKEKYSEEQCKQIHKEYAVFLQKLQSKLEQNQEYSDVNTILQYQRKIQDRLRFYNSKV